MPKGFLPEQDTGVIVAVTEAAQSISIPRMDERCRRRLSTSCKQDPDGDRYRGVVHRCRVSINATPNTGRLTIALLPRTRQRDADPPQAIANRLHLGCWPKDRRG